MTYCGYYHRKEDKFKYEELWDVHLPRTSILLRIVNFTPIKSLIGGLIIYISDEGVVVSLFCFNNM